MRRSEERWYFTKEQLNSTPSIKCGYSPDRELSCRQQAANFIQDMGQRLQVTQLCINTAIVYMHRFYMFHSFTQFHRTAISAAALFLAAKVEEQPRKLEHVIKVAYMCLHREQSQPLDIKSEQYLELAQDLVVNENVLLQTLGFDVAIDHPHTHVVQCCSLVKASKDLAQTSYFMASNSLHLTTMCLQYKPTLVACFCIHLAIKWSNWQIPESSEGRPWFWYVDQTVTQDALEQLTAEFLVIFDKCPSRLKRKIMTMSGSLDVDKKQKIQQDGNNVQSTSSMSQRPHGHGPVDESKQKSLDPMTVAPRTQHNYRKLLPQNQHGHQHGHGHGHHHHHHRDQKNHGHIQPNVSSTSVPPKKNPNRPPAPDCMFPPPIRISDQNRQMKTEQQQQQQQQHYKQRISSHSSSSMQQADMKQMSQPPPQSSFIPSMHHPPPPVSHSQKKQYEVPLQQQTQPPLPPPLPATPPPPPPPPTLPPPPPPPLPSSRHQDGALNNSNYNNVKQEVPEQSHRYDSSNVSTAAVKQEPNHNLYKQEPSSMLSNRLNAEQNHNRYINDSLANANNNSNSNLYNVNIKQEPTSTSSSSLSSEQNHQHHHHSSHQHSHHHPHHRNYNDNVNYNSNSSNNSNNYNGGVSGASSQVSIKQEQVHNVVEQQNHPNRYDNVNDFIKKEPGVEQNNHYQQAQQQKSLNDNRNANVDNSVSIKKEPTSSSYSNAVSSSYDNSRLPSSKQPSVQHSSKIPQSNMALTNRNVKAPSIFSPEKDTSPVSQNMPNVNVGSQNVQQQVTSTNVNNSNKLKRKRLSSGSDSELLMVPLVKKLQQEEIARYEDPCRTHVKIKDKAGASQLVVANSMTDGDWNLQTPTVNNESIEQDVVKPAVSTNHSIETVEVGATIEIADNFKEDRKHKEGREHKKKKKHKEHKEHKDRERHKHKEKHKSKDKHKETSSAVKTAETVSVHIEPSSGMTMSRTSSTPAPNSAPLERSSLKIKIPKDKIANAMPGLKVKFRKEFLQGSRNNQDSSNSQSSSSNHQRNLLKVSSSSTRHHDSVR